MKTALFNRFNLDLPDLAVDDCSHQGPCDKDVDYWHLQVSFNHITDDDLLNELREYGAWEIDELLERETNEKRLLWIAAGNLKEGQENDQ